MEYLLEAVFSMRSVPRIYIRDQLPLRESRETTEEYEFGACWPLVSSYTIRHDIRLLNWKDHGIIDLLSLAFAWQNWPETYTTSTRIGDVLAHIRTGNILNTSLRHVLLPKTFSVTRISQLISVWFRNFHRLFISISFYSFFTFFISLSAFIVSCPVYDLCSLLFFSLFFPFVSSICRWHMALYIYTMTGSAFPCCTSVTWQVYALLLACLTEYWLQRLEGVGKHN
jgi:hypothetical protein